MDAPIQEWLTRSKPMEGGNFLVPAAMEGKDWMLKFESATVSEICGNQLARVIGVQVPRTVPVWSSDAVYVERNHSALPYRIGSLSEWLTPAVEQSRDQAAQQFPLNTARALVLFMFNRHEWGEFLSHADGGYVFDLQGLLALMHPEDLYPASPASRREVAADIIRTHEYIPRKPGEPFEEASRLGLGELFIREGRRLMQMAAGLKGRLFKLPGHPVGDLVEEVMDAFVSFRVDQIRPIFA